MPWTNASWATVEDRRPELCRQLGRDPDRATERVPGDRGRLGRDACGQRVGHVAPVDRDADTAEDRDPQRAAELKCALGDARGGPGPLRRSRTDDQLGRQAEDRRQAERDDDRRAHHNRESVRARATDPTEDPEPDRGNAQCDPDQERRPDVAEEPGRRVRADDERDRRGHRPDPGLERREAEDQLQVLGDEDEVADRHEDRQEVDGERRAEGRNPEEADVDHRVGQRQLATDEQRSHDEADEDERRGRDAEPVLRDLLEPEDDRQHRDERHRDA